MVNALEMFQNFQNQERLLGLKERQFGDESQTRGIQNELLRFNLGKARVDMQREEQRRNALAQLSQGGGMNALMALDPKLAIQMQGMQAKERMGQAQIASRDRAMQARAAQVAAAQKAAAERADPARVGEREQAKLAAKAAIGLPDAIATAEQTIGQIDQLIGDEAGTIKPHKGFQGAVGVSGLGSGFGLAGFIPGTDVTDFKKRLDQVKGGAFLEAFNTLKGGGQITEIEGKKATAAITRMDTAQSEDEFKAAAREFQSTIRNAVDRAKQKAAPQRRATDGGGFKILGVEK